MRAAVDELEFTGNGLGSRARGSRPHSLAQSLARLERTYAVARALSLDVALAALAGGIMAARVVHTSPRPAFYLLLPTGVWVAYTLDHLLDGRRLGPTAHTSRHRLHFRHARPLWGLIGGVSLMALVLARVELSNTGLVFGIALAGLCVAHEWIVKLAGSRASPLLIKELGVALIFTAGTWGLPLMLHAPLRRPVDLALLLPAGQYLLLALTNLIEFSLYEANTDARDGHISFVLAVGPAVARRTTLCLLAAQLPLGLIATLCLPAMGRPELIYLAMSAVLLRVLLRPGSLRKHERYRSLADGAFLLPLLMLLR